MARLSKFLHATELEDWVVEHHPEAFSSWELSGLVEWVDFWDWLDEKCPEVFVEFKSWFKQTESHPCAKVNSSGRQTCCKICHVCNDALTESLDGELWCRKCGAYR